MSSDLFLITDIPIPDFSEGNYHAGMDCLLNLMARHGLKLYQSAREDSLARHEGLISPDDVVLLKVNAQWKYRGCTNSDVVRGLIQRMAQWRYHQRCIRSSGDDTATFEADVNSWVQEAKHGGSQMGHDTYLAKRSTTTPRWRMGLPCLGGVMIVVRVMSCRATTSWPQPWLGS